MSLTDYEQRVLDDMEAGLAAVSARPRWSHVVAAVAAQRLLLMALAIVVTVLGTGTEDANSAGIIVASTLSAVAFIGTGAVVWRDARNRAAGD